MYLRCLTGDHPRSWLQWLPWAEFCYNTSFQFALKTTPFNVVYGHDPPPLLKYEVGLSSVVVVDAHLRERDSFWQKFGSVYCYPRILKEHHNKKRRSKEL
jgi:hypothetical protein